MRSVAASGLIEPMRWWHIEQITALEEILFPGDSPWTAPMFWNELACGHYYVVVLNGENVSGYAGLAIVGDEAEVRTIGVHPDRQGRGLGRLLLADLLAVAGRRRVLLEVRTDNAAAIGLYESTGFQRVGLRRNYYRPSGADAYVMVREQESAR